MFSYPGHGAPYALRGKFVIFISIIIVVISVITYVAKITTDLINKSVFF